MSKSKYLAIRHGRFTIWFSAGCVV